MTRAVSLQAQRLPTSRERKRPAKLTVVNFAVRSRDTLDLDPDRITRRVIAGAAPGGNILLHDGSDRDSTPDSAATLKALPRITKQLLASGYRFVTVSALPRE